MGFPRYQVAGPTPIGSNRIEEVLAGKGVRRHAGGVEQYPAQGNDVSIELVCEPELAESRVPFLILQPLVENALRHGVSRKAGPGHIVVTGERAGGMLRLSVSDDGPGPLERRDGVGLANVRSRLKELYGEMGRLELGLAPGGGALAVVTLPLTDY